MNNEVFLYRVLLASLLGALIGLEREIRAKEAGIRTHFLVSLGSALFMIVSQHGFGDMLGITAGDGVDFRLDPSRVASQVVSGIGFIGAGTIMMHKQFVRGLTTAAGLWAVAGIGLAIGGGLYVLGIASAILVFVGLEILQILTKRFKAKCTELVFTTSSRENLVKVADELNKAHYHILSFSVDTPKNAPELSRVRLFLRERHNEHENDLLVFMQQFSDLTVDKVE